MQSKKTETAECRRGSLKTRQIELISKINMPYFIYLFFFEKLKPKPFVVVVVEKGGGSDKKYAHVALLVLHTLVDFSPLALYVEVSV